MTVSPPRDTHHHTDHARHAPLHAPSVSVILPVLDEQRYIDAAIQSLLAQGDPDLDLEILAVDGGSADGTVEKLAAWAARDPRVRRLENPARITPAAMNVGLREARGEFVCIFGAHATYAPDYIATCLRELRDRGAVGCSGRIVTRPAGSSLQARLVVWCLSHPFGSSRASVRTRSEGFVDHLPFPVFVKQPLLDVGGYDEVLLRNQDNDMCRKLRARGGRLYLTGRTVATYFPRDSVRRLLSYAVNTGRWNAVSLRRNPRSLGLHHLVPLAFVLAIVGGALLAAVGAANGAPGWWLLPSGWIALHLLVGCVVSIPIAWRQRSFGALLLPAVFLGFHLAYGLGTMWGVLARPRERRA